jgi:acetylglutamate kinase
MEIPDIRKGVLEDIVFMNYVGMRPVLVHGGGPEISREMRKAGKKVEFIEGLRVTDEQTIAIVDTTLAKINKSMVKEIKDLGGKAKGLCGIKDAVIKAERKAAKVDLGYTGEIKAINIKPIKDSLSKGNIPVISPLGTGPDNKPYNINADHTASMIASALDAEKIVLLTNVKGIMADKDDQDSVLSTVTEAQVQDLLERKIVEEGMIPKVKAAIDALDGGVRKAHVIDGKLEHSLLLEIFTDKGIGTEIIKK